MSLISHSKLLPTPNQHPSPSSHTRNPPRSSQLHRLLPPLSPLGRTKAHRLTLLTRTSRPKRRAKSSQQCKHKMDRSSKWSNLALQMVLFPSNLAQSDRTSSPPPTQLTTPAKVMLSKHMTLPPSFLPHTSISRQSLSIPPQILPHHIFLINFVRYQTIQFHSFRAHPLNSANHSRL
ncbi:hypothetical protein BLNAU_506 [Blattamonas nauphoetae]|uniref:Uncharacterized protein n=1 Tax=Blattamonas nauphoetae TaxID=2049346 RepID=A0ABQ9YLF5_9EUKA|nr:hypothetical protein BLNAU_506 [Blattamonas nauphoetae]